MRKIPLITDYIYHIYNRGVDKRVIYCDSSHYIRFVSMLEHFLKLDYPYSILRNRLKDAKTKGAKEQVLKDVSRHKIDPPVEFVSFCLMPNHYHLAIKQLQNGGISEYIHKIATGYTRYFNIQNNRTGRLFESSFKSVRVESGEQLTHLSRYHHLNPYKLINSKRGLIEYPWSSFSTYLGKSKYPFVRPEIVMENFSNSKDYERFVFAKIDNYEPLRIGYLSIDDDLGWFEKFRSLDKEVKESLNKQYLHIISN